MTHPEDLPDPEGSTAGHSTNTTVVSTGTLPRIIGIGGMWLCSVALVYRLLVDYIHTESTAVVGATIALTILVLGLTAEMSARLVAHHVHKHQ